MPARLKFRLDVTISDDGQLAAANLVMRDGDTRVSKSLGGWPVPAEDTWPPGADIVRLLDAIWREIEEAQARARDRR